MNLSVQEIVGDLCITCEDGETPGDYRGIGTRRGGAGEGSLGAMIIGIRHGYGKSLPEVVQPQTSPLHHDVFKSLRLPRELAKHPRPLHPHLGQHPGGSGVTGKVPGTNAVQLEGLEPEPHNRGCGLGRVPVPPIALVQ